jgi:hypothetical protein
MARVVWKENALVSIKLRDDLYTIGQMLVSPSMRFYDIPSKDGIWKSVDLNYVKPLFQVFVGQVVMQKLVAEKVKEKTVVASNSPFESLLIKPHVNYDGGFPWRGGKLVDIGLDGKIGTTLAPVIKQNLDLPEDRETVEKYELTNMWGDQDLTDRLCRYFDTGVNRDDLKFEVFPGLWDDREKLRPLTRRLPVPLR